MEGHVNLEPLPLIDWREALDNDKSTEKNLK